jgi:CubicO group peptidase (beta-lactamase class C family)
MRLRTISLLLLAVLFTGAASAQPAPVPTERLDSLVTAYHDARLFNGAVLVGNGDSVAYARAVGDANRAWDVPLTPDTRFHVGSVTKQFTAALILQLVAEDKVALDSTVATYLPDYPGPGADRITIHHLLSHRSGIPSFTGFEDYESRIMRMEWEPDSLVAEFANRGLQFEPGTQWSYSNSGYFLLGVIAQEVTGMTYPDALREKVLAPLGLDGPVGYAFSDEVIEREASGYRQTVWGYRPAEPIESSVPLSAGMLYATPEGLHRWTRALHTGAVLPDSLYDAMTTPHAENGYGYGLVMQSDTIAGTPVSVTGHGGGINGFTSSLTYVTPGDYTVVALDNTQSGSTSRLTEGIRQVLYGGAPPQPQPSVARALWDVLQDQTVADATARYRTLKREQPDAYEYGAAEVVALGDALREKERAEQAAGIYEFAISMDSTLADAHAGLGLAQKTLGNRAAAERHLRATLDRNPGHSDAKRALRAMGIETASPDVSVPPETLERYTGVYAARKRPSFKMTVTRQGDQLYTQATGQQKVKVYPSSETTFYLKVVDAQIEFTVEDGSVPRLTLYQRGQEIVFERTDGESK